MYKIREVINDTIPNYKVNNLPERYNEALLKKIELTMKENNTVMKKLNLTWTKFLLAIWAKANQFIC